MVAWEHQAWRRQVEMPSASSLDSTSSHRSSASPWPVAQTPPSLAGTVAVISLSLASCFCSSLSFSLFAQQAAGVTLFAPRLILSLLCSSLTKAPPDPPCPTWRARVRLWFTQPYVRGPSSPPAAGILSSHSPPLPDRLRLLSPPR